VTIVSSPMAGRPARTPQTFADVGIDIPAGRTSGQIKVFCPECHHGRRHQRDRSLSVDLDHGRWLCHNPGCEWKGSLGGMAWQDRVLAPPVPKTYIRPTSADLPRSDDEALTVEVLAWLRSRRIDPAVVERNGLTWDRRTMPNSSGPVPVIAFPFRRDGETVNVQYRAFRDKQFKVISGAELPFYGLDDCEPTEETVVIVEGQMDKLAIETVDPSFIRILSVPNGTGGQSGTFPYLASAESVIAATRDIVLAMDTDEPGEVFRQRLMDAIGPDRCRIVEWPIDCKDANETLIAHGPETVARCVRQARRAPVAGLVEMQELRPAMRALRQEGRRRGLTTGLAGLDQLYSVKPGQFTVVTGAPSCGKSLALDQIMVNMAEAHDSRFVVFSPEQYPMEEHLIELVEKRVRKPYFPPRHQAPTMTDAEADDAVAWLHEHIWFIDPEDPTIEALIELVNVAIIRHQVMGVVLDPWNEIQHAWRSGETETQYISRTLSVLRRFVRLRSVHLWVLAHPTKMPKDDNGDYGVVSPYDISGSSSWYSKADNILSVWRSKTDESQPNQIYVQKIRWKGIGRLGRCYADYDPITARLTDPGMGRAEFAAGAAA